MQDLNTTAKSLEAQISMATPKARQSLQPKLEQVLVQFQQNGLKVPKRLSRLNNELIDELIEARFDNMPV